MSLRSSSHTCAIDLAHLKQRNIVAVAAKTSQKTPDACFLLAACHLCIILTSSSSSMTASRVSLSVVSLPPLYFHPSGVTVSLSVNAVLGITARIHMLYLGHIGDWRRRGGWCYLRGAEGLRSRCSGRWLRPAIRSDARVRARAGRASAILYYTII